MGLVASAYSDKKPKQKKRPAEPGVFERGQKY